MQPFQGHNPSNEGERHVENAFNLEENATEQISYQERIQRAVVAGFTKIQGRAKAKQSSKKIGVVNVKAKTEDAREASRKKAKLAREEKKRIELERKEAELDRKQAEFELALVHRERARQLILQKKQAEQSKVMLAHKLMREIREERLQRRQLESQELQQMQVALVQPGEKTLWQEVVEKRSRDKLHSGKRVPKSSSGEDMSKMSDQNAAAFALDAARSRTIEYFVIAMETAALKHSRPLVTPCDAVTFKDLANRLESCLFSETIDGTSAAASYDSASGELAAQIDQGSMREYSARARALVRGIRLQDNEHVLSSLLQGRVTPEELLAIESSGQLLSEKCRKQKAMLVADSLAQAAREAKSRRTLDPYSDRIQCPQCESWGAHYERIPHAGGHHLGKTPSLGGPTGAKITCECASCGNNFRTDELP